jgi:6-pyruvoyltetrahydropterin/6-carboxytetrahydropterin synthase
VYGCGVIRRFRAKHALANVLGSESRPHFHDYTVEISVKGPALNEDGFLLNLAELEEKADDVVTFLLSYSSLNEVPGIKGKNPSAENLATCILENIAQRLDLQHLDSLAVMAWENESAWASSVSSAEELRRKAGK